MLTLCSVEGSWPWGTARGEHRWNPELIREMSLALDRVEADPEVEAPGKGIDERRLFRGARGEQRREILVQRHGPALFGPLLGSAAAERLQRTHVEARFGGLSLGHLRAGSVAFRDLP